MPGELKSPREQVWTCQVEFSHLLKRWTLIPRPPTISVKTQHYSCLQYTQNISEGTLILDGAFWEHSEIATPAPPAIGCGGRRGGRWRGRRGGGASSLAVRLPQRQMLRGSEVGLALQHCPCVLAADCRQSYLSASKGAASGVGTESTQRGGGERGVHGVSRTQ